MRFRYYLKQLIPRNHWTKYTNSKDEQMLCLWKMWLGKSYDITHIKIN